ncbi:cytochrome P450 2H2-like [Mizuhopecten yessoensis]|uniref:Cytochrome P450 2J6 n=1 Tax=Mizuhopecten yessoensis TaxID=6573 RepID=A0A210QR17_MIZYE|nr:cytochrome P450 2H2-like [Mizuhopecten yessoensis]OWF51175.1 Cytochrome P450 2J6 [Mizuhopecten yessoensis]
MFGVLLELISGSSGLVWTLLVLVVAYYLWNRHQRLKSLPPGPTPLPLLGNILNLAGSSDPLQTFRKLREKYGDLVTLHVGSYTIVVVSGYDTLRELFVKRGDVTSDRPNTFAFREITKGEGIVSRSGAEWKTQRTFAIGGLRDFGFGKKSLEGKIREEVEIFLMVLDVEEGKPLHPESFVQTSVANIICAIVFGKRFEHGDPTFIELLTLINENMSLVAPSGLLNFFPSLRYVPGDPAGCRKVLNNAEKIIKYLYNVIDAHQKDYDEENLKDFIDVYLKELKDKEGQDTSFTVSQLMNTIADMLIAGMETTTTTLLWAILFFLNNPDVQKRCHEEVMKVVGEGRFPSLSDRSQMPYIEATITEILRCGNIVPLGVPHATSEDVHFKGHIIPKGTMLMPNIVSVHTNPQKFPDPGKFNPSRFIDSDGKVSGTDHVISFFFGRRVCMGEALARSELFLFLTSMVQRFQFKPEDPDNIPPVKGNLGITFKPCEYKCIAEKRV